MNARQRGRTTASRALRISLAIMTIFAMGIDGRAEAEYLSPEAIIADAGGKTLYIAEATANQVVAWDIAADKVSRTYPMPDPPGGLALSSDGTRLYVTGASPTGRVHVLDARTGGMLAALPAGHTPAVVVVSPDGKTLYVCNRFNNNVALYDLSTNKQVATVAVSREPVAAAVTPDGKSLFVANLLPVGPADAETVAAVVSVISTAARKVAATIQLPNGSTSVHGLCLSPDGRYAYVTHVLARYSLPTTQLDRGWVNTSALSVIDATRPALVNTVLLDDIDLGGANPWGVACSPDGRYLCVAHAGTHEVSVIDRPGLHDKLEKAAAGDVGGAGVSPGSPPQDDLSFLRGLRRRLKLSGNGPRGLTVVGDTAYVVEYFSNSLGAVDIRPSTTAKARSLALGSREPLTDVRRGEMLFHDATVCFQQWQSCSTCHPGSARVDGLNWDLLNDGLGSPRNNKSLLLAHQTPPSMAMGVRSDAKAAVRAGIRHVLFAERPEEDAIAIDEYLKSLKPVPSPHLVNGQLSPAAVRGREVFEQAGCSRCHPAPLYTDLASYDVGTGKGRDAGRPLDTPTLAEVWRTAPYLHDGRAATIEEVFTRHNPGDKHGVTSGLSTEQIRDLAEFVLSQ